MCFSSRTFVFVWYITTCVWYVHLCTIHDTIVMREIPFYQEVKYLCRSGLDGHADLLATWGVYVEGGWVCGGGRHVEGGWVCGGGRHVEGVYMWRGVGLFQKFGMRQLLNVVRLKSE